jgi:hypothetical protein
MITSNGDRVEASPLLVIMVRTRHDGIRVPATESSREGPAGVTIISGMSANV